LYLDYCIIGKEGKLDKLDKMDKGFSKVSRERENEIVLKKAYPSYPTYPE